MPSAPVAPDLLEDAAAEEVLELDLPAADEPALEVADVRADEREPADALERPAFELTLSAVLTPLEKFTPWRPNMPERLPRNCGVTSET